MSDSKVSRKGLSTWFKSKKTKASSRVSDNEFARRRQSAGSSHRVRFESVNSITETPATKSHVFRKDTPEKEAQARLTKSKNIFRSFRTSKRRTKPKTNEVFKELLAQFEKSDFEFQFDGAGNPQNMNIIIDDSVEEPKQEMLRTKQEDDDVACNLRDTYMTKATDNKRLSIGSTAKYNFSTDSINTAKPKSSLSSVPLGQAKRKASVSSDTGVVQSI